MATESVERADKNRNEAAQSRRYSAKTILRLGKYMLQYKWMLGLTARAAGLEPGR